MQLRQAELTRKESKLITRMRLLEGALHLLAKEGYASLTASKVAKAAGIAQPSFYVHFRDKDDLLETLAREKFGALRLSLREIRAKIPAKDPADWLRAFSAIALIRETFRVSIEALLENPELFRLYVGERYQPNSPLGRYARELSEDLQRELAEDLIRIGAPVKTAAQREHLALVAAGIISLTENLGMGVLTGRFSDVNQVVDALVQFALGALPIGRQPAAHQ